MAKKIIVGNWKLNPQSLEEAELIVKTVSRKLPKTLTVVVCPPAVFLSRLATGKRKSSLRFGVQDVFSDDSGAITGEYGPKMARSAGADYVIIGHSERRALGENAGVINKKLRASLKAGLISILCVGEKERDHYGHYLSFLKAQIEESIDGVTRPLAEKLVVAYEPVWAIGEKSRGAMEPRDLHETSLFIRKVLHGDFGNKAFSIPLLYGGSVDPVNAKAMIKEGNVDGLLVGRESLNAKHFLKIIEAAG